MSPSWRAQTDSSGKNRPIIAAVPLIFYTPETRWGFGASGAAVFNWKSDTLRARSSTLNAGMAVTLNRQMFFVVPFHLFLKNASHQLYGEVAYNRYYYNFYGTGNKTPDDHVERYGLEFPRIRLTWLKKLAGSFYAGPRLVYDSFTLYEISPSGLFASGQVKGAEGGTVLGPAAVFMYDDRDLIFYPRSGSWTELVYFRNMAPGSAVFNRVAFDHSRYISWHPKKILALNLYAIYSPDDLPFYQMGMLGGAKKMRGFYEGRYRDNNVVLAQAEYRRWITGIVGVTVFASAGQVAPRVNLFHHSHWRYTCGAGVRLRIDKERNLNLRMDAAWGNGRILSYFTVGEAF